MKLISVENYTLKIADEIYLIKPFRKLAMQDKSKHKERLLSQLSYIYYVYDPRSTYMYMPDEESRMAAVIEQEGLPADFKPDKLLLEAIEYYKKHTITVSQMILQDAKIAVNKVRKYITDLDLTETYNGKPIHNISAITSALEKLPKLAESIKIAERNVEKETNEIVRMRGGGESEASIMDGNYEF